MINIQAGRILYHTSEIAMNGGFGTAIQHELSLYPTARSRDIQNKVLDFLMKSIFPNNSKVPSTP